MAPPGSARRRALFARLALLLLAVLFLAGATLFDRLLGQLRIDLTEDGAFTLADDTERLLAGVEEPVVLRFYFSSRIAREIPQVAAYARHVRDLLEEFAAHSGGKVQLQVFDPEPFTDAEDRADSFGLHGVPVDQTGERVFFGLAGTNSIDDVEVIPFFDESRERDLEYDIARIVHSLAHPERPKVGLITGLPIAGSPMSQSGRGSNDAWTIYNLLLDFADVQQIVSTATAVPEGVGAVVLVHPKQLSDETLYALDQFALRGGKLLVFVDPHSEGEAQNPEYFRTGPPPGGLASDLERLFRTWGVEMPADRVAGDAARARRVQVSPDRSRTRLMAIDYPVWIAVDRDGIAANDPVTAELNRMNLASPGHIRLLEDAAVALSPLLTTTARGGTAPVSLLQGAVDPVAVAGAFEEAGAPLVLAARLSGEVESAFPEGPPEAGEAEEADLTEAEKAERQAEREAALAAHLARSSAPLRVAVVADVDMLADPMWMVETDMLGERIGQPVADNAAFFINLIEDMTVGNDLISLRSRGRFQRPFTLVDDIRREAESRHRAKERELLDRLDEAQTQLRTLEGDPAAGSQMVLSPAQTEMLHTLRTDIIALRRELRDVQYQLRREVEQLAARLKLVNIALIPALVAVFALAVAIVRRIHRRQPQQG